MSDRFEQDPEETAKILRKVRERDSQVWGNKVASADVTPAMVIHTDEPGCRCICGVCDGTRVQGLLPVTLKSQVFVNRHKHHRLLFADRFEQPELEHRGPEPRKPVRANKPVEAPPGVYTGRFGSRLWG